MAKNTEGNYKFMDIERIKSELHKSTGDFENLIKNSSEFSSISQGLREYIIRLLEISRKTEEEILENHLDINILDNAFLLAKSSTIIFSNLLNSEIIALTQKDSQETYSSITDCIVGLLNIIDFESPSWYPIKHGHLKSGIEFVAAKSYILRTYMPLEDFEDSESQNFIGFPEF